MLPKPEPACLVIADISGYTAAPEFDASLLQDTIEGAYFAFRRRLRDIKQASICECDACRLIPTLDLKFVAHCGQIAKQIMSGQEELIGRDVILIHRLLKNDVEAKLARHAYALYTEAFAQRTGMKPQAQGLTEHHETVEIIGDVRCWLRDLEDAWQAEQARKRIEVTAADAIASFVIDVDAPRQTTWEFLTAPGHRVMPPPVRPASRRMSRTGGAAPGRSTIAFMARTSSSRKFSIGSLPIISPGEFSCSTPA
jgi:Protein of unknown function (DUF2652)